MKFWRILIILLLVCLSSFIAVPEAWAFCGFYVAKADAKLYNQASQVVIARDGDRTVLTMANDYQGDVKDFAIVVPVPVVLQQQQVKVTEPKIIERLDAFSAPRLVEYFDPDPCKLQLPVSAAPSSGAERAEDSATSRSGGALGVTIENKFSVGEYDILILSAKESGGLQTWLTQNGYKLPQGAKSLLQPYIRQKLKFFVAKVNLKEFDKAGAQTLRPIQIAFESRRFMLPIRLGMINARSAQDLIVYVLSPKGQAEVTNYRTVKVPSGNQIPVFVKNEFSNFYKTMFETVYNREDRKVAFVEYAWDMGNCDPCSAEPLTEDELKQAGVFWLDGESASRRTGNSFLTRLHIRYTRDKFPEDLMFHETGNRDSFQGRYVLQHPFTGEATCSAGRQYRRSLSRRFEQEAQTLARLTNWNIEDIRKKQPQSVKPLSWWQQFLSMFLD